MWQYRSTEELYHSDDYLMHYGVLGMKWRVHRYNSLKSTFDQIKANQKNYKQGYEDSKNQFKNKNKLKQAKKTRNREIAKDFGKTVLGGAIGGLIGTTIDKRLNKKGINTHDLGNIIGTNAGIIIGSNKGDKNLKKAGNAYNYVQGYKEKNTTNYKKTINRFNDSVVDMDRTLSAYNDVANINKKKKKK